MKKHPVGDDIIKECPSCRGIWFEQGQLDAVKDEVLPEMAWFDVATVKEKFDFKISINPLFCPQCPDEISLTKIQDSNTGTEFSLCVQCKGKWLTTGQILNLIQLLLDEADQKSAPELMVISLHKIKALLMNPDPNMSDWKGLKSVLSLLKHRIFSEQTK